MKTHTLQFHVRCGDGGYVYVWIFKPEYIQKSTVVSPFLVYFMPDELTAAYKQIKNKREGCNEQEGK